ncbi:uncharacterized protein J8A68_005728 [[Candida] subhashii]|uniref:Uncharacterized protein n=1 Tax=[Candida] subhashii TaxID=561895 RepID=A0A8J5UJ39_9ASCO|nr:uncharacterized protein J8A68_005728 [[Candida] subhashii]KAG7660766.1 hypothetical protein J8A68_005728 [[Candida] subhashii]
MSEPAAARRARRKANRNTNSSRNSSNTPSRSATPGLLVDEDQEFENDLDFLLTNTPKPEVDQQYTSSSFSEVYISSSWETENKPKTAKQTARKHEKKFTVADVTKDMIDLDFSSDSEDEKPKKLTKRRLVKQKKEDEQEVEESAVDIPRDYAGSPFSFGSWDSSEPAPAHEVTHVQDASSEVQQHASQKKGRNRKEKKEPRQKELPKKDAKPESESDAAPPTQTKKPRSRGKKEKKEQIGDSVPSSADQSFEQPPQAAEKSELSASQRRRARRNRQKEKEREQAAQGEATTSEEAKPKKTKTRNKSRKDSQQTQDQEAVVGESEPKPVDSEKKKRKPRERKKKEHKEVEASDFIPVQPELESKWSTKENTASNEKAEAEEEHQQPEVSNDYKFGSFIQEGWGEDNTGSSWGGSEHHERDHHREPRERSRGGRKDKFDSPAAHPTRAEGSASRDVAGEGWSREDSGSSRRRNDNRNDGHHRREPREKHRGFRKEKAVEAEPVEEQQPTTNDDSAFGSAIQTGWGEDNAGSSWTGNDDHQQHHRQPREKSRGFKKERSEEAEPTKQYAVYEEAEAIEQPVSSADSAVSFGSWGEENTADSWEEAMTTVDASWLDTDTDEDEAEEEGGEWVRVIMEGEEEEEDEDDPVGISGLSKSQKLGLAVYQNMVHEFAENDFGPVPAFSGLFGDGSFFKRVVSKNPVRPPPVVEEKPIENPFAIKLRPIKKLANKNLSESLPEIQPTKTIIGLSHKQILQADLSDVKIKTLMSSSSVSKYAATCVRFTRSHGVDLFEDFEKKKIFLQLCINIALYESKGFKRTLNRYSNVLELFGGYREINLETTRTQLTPSKREVHQNNLDYSVLAYLGHILIWAGHLQRQAKVAMFTEKYDLEDLSQRLVMEHIGGYHLWDRLQRNSKGMNSKRWKHVIKFRNAFPFEEDQFMIILRFMQIDNNIP